MIDNLRIQAADPGRAKKSRRGPASCETCAFLATSCWVPGVTPILTTGEWQGKACTRGYTTLLTCLLGVDNPRLHMCLEPCGSSGLPTRQACRFSFPHWAQAQSTAVPRPATHSHTRLRFLLVLHKLQMSCVSQTPCERQTPSIYFKYCILMCLTPTPRL